MADTLEQIADKIVDSGSNEFNTEIHVSRDGQPVYTKAGRFKKKPKSTSVPKSTVAIEPEVSESFETETAPAYSEMGTVMATTVSSCCTMLFGEEWKPENSELDAMQMAWAKYFQATGMQEFPPWAMLAMVHMSYAGKRMVMPQTKGRIARLVDKFRRRKAPQYAHSDNRNDQQREDNAGEVIS